MRFHSERTELKLEIRGGQIHLAVGKYVRMGAENSPTSSSVGVADLSARWKAFAYLILFSIYRIILVIRGGNGFTDDGVGERERGFRSKKKEERERVGGGWRRRRFIIKPAGSKIRGGWQPLSNGSSVRVSSPQNPSPLGKLAVNPAAVHVSVRT